jgi:trans-2,3-dihydro-3-hydroxyanthranilate isomerase
MSGSTVEVTLVEACLRDGAGGSPTAVVVIGERPTDAGLLDDAELARIPARTGTSHVAVIGPHPTSPGTRTFRFFTAAGELPGCGHGTIAAIAVLRLEAPDATTAMSSSVSAPAEGQRRRPTWHSEVDPELRPDSVVEVWFDQGQVQHRGATATERAAFLAALGLHPDALHPDDEVAVASPGRPRLLIPVADRTVLAGLRPDQERLAKESRRFGQLGCFVYVPPSSAQPTAARMFAPAIGVPEDVANANSSGCLAAYLLATGRRPNIAVDQGDALGRPSRVLATAVRAAGGIATRVGGTARVQASKVILT